MFVPTAKTVTAQEAKQLLQDNGFTKFGIRISIISDRDPKFISSFWTSITQLLNVKLNISTTDHPRTDGHSEIMIRSLSNMLRKSIQEAPKHWHEILSTLDS